MNNLENQKRLKGYSLLEVIISLTIIAFCTIIMLNFTVVAFRITSIGLARGVVREELSNVLNSIGRDFKNSDLSPVCNPEGTSCDFYLNGVLYKWYLCEEGTKICRDRFNTETDSFSNIYKSSETVNINYFKFEPGFSATNLSGVSNIILTIGAGHSNESLGVNNVVKQVSFSVRNFTL